MWWSLFLLPLSLFANISALYLSWYDDPTTTMTVQWHTLPHEFGDVIYLQNSEGEWEKVLGEHVTLDRVLIHKVSLSKLTPDTSYSFFIEGDEKIYTFKTAPLHLNRPLKFFVGSDIYAKKKLFCKMCKTILKHKPDFIVLGGDVAHANSIHPLKTFSLRRWLSFFKSWKEEMIDPSGHIIPFLIIPGGNDLTAENYDLFFSLFGFPKKELFRALDFGSYLSLILLDTGHFQPIEGVQTLWLEKTLKNRTAIPFRFAIYHEAGYPTFQKDENATTQKIRTHWSPLFEKYHLLAAFENHNFSFKRTHPIKDREINPEGVIYLGDGGWPRKLGHYWYLAKKERKSTISLVEITPQEAQIMTYDFKNQKIDELTIPK